MNIVSSFKNKWPLFTTMAIANLLLLFVTACPPRTDSILYNGEKVTAGELQIEIETLLATAKIRQADLEQQKQWRDLILKNALIMVESGTFNPLSITTAMFAFYGFGNAANSVKNIVKKKKKTT